MKIFTVLKSGGDFRPEHVYAIEDMCNKYIEQHEFDFYCLTDLTDMRCNIIPLERNLSTWWSKLELFKHIGPILYFDLDIMITSNIDHIISKLLQYKFCGLKDQSPYRPDEINSTIMYWQGDMSWLFKDFIKDPESYMKEFSSDQVYITNKVESNRVFIQSLAPGEIVSYKMNLDHGTNFDSRKHKIVFFHGLPRPWQQNNIPYKY